MADDATPGSADDAPRRADVSPSDRSLLRQIRHGDQDAATQLYERYASRLLALARSGLSADLVRRVDGDDIVQSVFGSFFRRVSNGSYDVPDDEELWGLFLVITLNKIREKGVYHRAAKRDVRHTAGDAEMDNALDVLTSNSQAASVLRLSVEEALGQLPERQRSAIMLRMEGYEVADIARLTGRSKRSVERMLQEGRARLSELLAD
jgi:RNA polymerase sigma-70 factor (ECF subfamily)